MTDHTIASDTLVATPSSLWRRLAGLVYDLVAVVAIVMVVGMICQITTGGQLVHTGAQTSIAWWYRPLQYVVVAAYFAASWLRGGQTLGMRPWRMRLCMKSGDRVTLVAALVRTATVSLPLLVLAIGHVTSPRTAMLTLLAVWVVFFAVALFDKRRRTLHDIFAGTELVHVSGRAGIARH